MAAVYVELTLNTEREVTRLDKTKNVCRVLFGGH